MIDGLIEWNGENRLVMIPRLQLEVELKHVD